MRCLPLLTGILLLAAQPAAGQDAVPAPVTVTEGGVRAEVYADLTAEEEAHLRRRLGIGATPHGPALTLDVGLGPEADNLQALTFTPSGDRILTANARSDNLAVLDAATGATLAVVPVGENPVAVAATDDVAVVACADDDTVTLVDLESYAVRAVVAGVPNPGGVRILPGGTRALVGSILGGGARVLDLATGAVLVTIPGYPFDSLELTITFPSLRQYRNYQPLVASVTGDTLFAVTLQPSPAVVYYSSRTGALLRTVPVDVPPRSFARSADGRTLVVGNFYLARAFQAVDVATGAVADPVPLPLDLVGLVSSFALSADGSAAFVGLRRPDQSAFAAAEVPLNGSPPTLLETRSFEFGTAASPDGRHALGVGVDGAGVYSFETGALTVLTPGRWYVAGGASAAEARWAGVPINHPGEVVSAFRADPSLHDGDFLPGGPDEGDAPDALGLSADGATALVANIYTSALSHLDLATRTVTALTPVSNLNPGEVSVLGDGLALVTGSDSTGLVRATALVALGSGAEVGRLPELGFRRFARGVAPVVFGWSDDDALVQLAARPEVLDLVAASPDSLVAALAASDDGRLLAVADRADGVRLLDGASGALLDRVEVPDAALVAVAPGGGRAYAMGAGDLSIRRYRVDGATVTEEAPIPCGCGTPVALAATDALVAALSPPLVYRFDAATGAPEPTVTVPYGAAVRLALTASGEPVVLTEDPDAVHLPGRSYDLPGRPSDFAFSAAAGLALSIDKTTDTVTLGEATPVGVEDGPEAGSLALRIAPNPARGAVRLDYTWAGPPSRARLAVYDALGRLVHRTATPPQGPGRHTLRWTPGDGAPSGVYLVRLTVGDQTAQTRVTLFR